MKNKLDTIAFFVDNILLDMENIDASTTKINLNAYISAWKTNLKTIKSITDEKE